MPNMMLDRAVRPSGLCAALLLLALVAALRVAHAEPGSSTPPGPNACTLGDRGTGPDPRVWFAEGSQVLCHNCNTCTCEGGEWSFIGLPCPSPRPLERCRASDVPASDVRSELLYLSGSELAFALEARDCGEPAKLCWDGSTSDTTPPTVNLRVMRLTPQRCSGPLREEHIVYLEPLAKQLASPVLISIEGQGSTLFTF